MLWRRHRVANVLHTSTPFSLRLFSSLQKFKSIIYPELGPNIRTFKNLNNKWKVSLIRKWTGMLWSIPSLASLPQPKWNTHIRSMNIKYTLISDYGCVDFETRENPKGRGKFLFSFCQMKNLPLRYTHSLTHIQISRNRTITLVLSLLCFLCSLAHTPAMIMMMMTTHTQEGS